MSTSFEELIRQDEPRPLTALHGAKVALAIVALISIPVALVGLFLGFGSTIWLYATLPLLVVAILVAFFANKWSESLFARRAAELGLDSDEARNFWRAYDWDQEDA